MKNEKKKCIFFFILPVAERNEKKKLCILMFLGIFPIACVKKKIKKMYICIFG